MLVHTDVLDMDISLTGGTITRADLNVYSRLKGHLQPVRLENHDSPETLYLLQVGMTGPPRRRSSQSAGHVHQHAAELPVGAGSG